MTYDEYCTKLNSIYTSLATPQTKELAIISLQQDYLSFQDKLGNLVKEIEYSSPDIPSDIFYPEDN